MGCDIHIYVEVKKNGKWEHFKENHFEASDFDKSYYKKEKVSQPFDWRHYAMFGVLAGVRNRDVVPIKEKRGLPEDISEDVKISRESYGEEGHSTSYLTARELYEFDYNKNPFSGLTKRKVLLEKVAKETTFLEENKIEDYEYYDLIHPESMFFTHINELCQLGDLDDVRVVFWFDN